MDTRQKGDLSELLVLAELVKRGYAIAIPYGSQPGWDLLVEVDGKWEKWQVKTVQRSPEAYNHPYAQIQKGGSTPRVHIQYKKEYKKGDFDVLIVVDSENDVMWKIPGYIALTKKHMSLKSNTFLWKPDPKIKDFNPAIQSNLL